MKVRISRNLFAGILIDLILIFCSFYFSYLIRFDFDIPTWHRNSMKEWLPYVVIGKICIFYFFDLYKGMWRYTGLKDLIDITKASTIATLGLVATVLYVNRFEMISRSVFIIDWCLTLFFTVSYRVFVRICFEQFTENVSLSDLFTAILKIFRTPKKNGRKVIIVGAGDCGENICREFKENPTIQSHVVGFLDDDPTKIGKKIHGVSVLNSINELEHTARTNKVNDVIIAIPSIGSERMRHIVKICQDADVNFKTVPDMGELIDGRITLNAIRNVEYRDLLGRDPVKLDKEKIGNYLGQKTVLVTGAAGSIGKGLCRQICRYAPDKIILFERAESPLYELDLELKKSFPKTIVLPILADIQNKTELMRVFSQVKPDIVFHAAAYKHVPMLESFPWKAVENNVIGTENLIEAALSVECERFVFVSTDKAVNPTNVMGTSKRVAELMVQECGAQSCNIKTRFMIVRFGNVIGSDGSVIPLFKRQIKEGGPVTVTHPDIIRYFMLIPEACQLILQAGAMGIGKEIFVLEMGKPVKIDSMARDLIRFSGFEPDVDIQIKYTGLRPGEKLFEELITKQEDVVPTNHKKIMVLRSNVCIEGFPTKLEQLKNASFLRDYNRIKNAFKNIVPEYEFEANMVMNNEAGD